MKIYKSKTADEHILKCTCWVVMSNSYTGIPQIERVFSDRPDAEAYINWQMDDRTYTIEKSFYVERQLPF